MPVARPTTTRRPLQTPVKGRRGRSAGAATGALALAPAAGGLAADTVSAQRAGGPQDSAHYQCDCGRAFRASVSTTVGCPACGAAQDW